MNFATISTLIKHQVNHEKEKSEITEPVEAVEIPAVKAGISCEICGEVFEKISLVIKHQLECRKAT